jgi:hypothetical protein
MPVVAEFEIRSVENKDVGDDGHVTYRDEEWVMLRIDPKTVAEFRILEIVPIWTRRANPRADDTAVDKEDIEQARWFLESHKAWKNGEQLQIDGTDIRMWPLISMAQCKAARKMGILSVEAIAKAEDNDLQYVPKGRWLKAQAQEWLSTAKDSGKMVQDHAKLKAENEDLQRQMDEMKAEVASMLAAQKQADKKPAKGKQKAA